MDIGGIVTIRFQRLSESSKSNADGFLLPYGCAGSDGESRCKQRPALLLTSNIQQSAACADHIVGILNELIDGILRSRNGEHGYGFLRRPELPIRHRSASLKATQDIVWQSQLDDRYDVTVFRATSPCAGVEIICEGNREIYRCDVGLAFNAIMGPDAADVQEWMDTAVDVVDASKPPQQIMAEAIRRIEAERQSRIAQLHTSKNADKAYQLAFDAYRSAETAVNWLLTTNALLDGKSPVEVLDQPHGLERVERALNDTIKTIYPLS